MIIQDYVLIKGGYIIPMVRCQGYYYISARRFKVYEEPVERRLTSFDNKLLFYLLGFSCSLRHQEHIDFCHTK